MSQIWSTIHFQKIWSTKYTVSTKIHFFNVKVESSKRKQFVLEHILAGETEPSLFQFFCKAAEPRSESEPAKV
jgi:hypothetical protein